MPASLHQPASNLKSLHLLRALLREASYLPDATARTYFRRYIVNRFKAYQPKQNATASFDVRAVDKYRHRSFKRRKIAIINERTRPMLRKGQKGLNFLRRANLGELPCLQKVLYFTYGRLGRRKYVLLDDLLKPDPPIDDGATISLADFKGPTPLQELYYSNKRYLQFFDAPKATSKTHHVINISDRYSRLRTVVKSQYQKGISLQKILKSPALKTPINNIWERPMPIKRARNNVLRWYAKTLSRLLPPLPTDEWDNMHAMIVGEKRVSLAKPRTRAVELQAHSQPVEEQFRDMLRAGLALDKPSRADKPVGVQRPHTITAKFMRRLYVKVLALCCKLEYDPEQKWWKAVWGGTMKSIKPGTYLTPVDESLFVGVDATGRLPKKTKNEEKGDHDPALQPRNDKGVYTHYPFFTEYLPDDHPLLKELAAWKAVKAERAGR